MKELTLKAIPENVDKAIGFVDEILEEYGCGMKEQMAIDVAVDELFANIAHYAYDSETGYATVKAEVITEPLSVKITFIDSGKPYNPLAKADPDTTQSVEDRKIGGMGIFIVKKSMDDIHYEYKDNQNILTITKKL
ncbi:MAG: ATP-binding protein [Clostridia bacterium]|nr:ATP-binding protein [Clostridia bacterium]